MPIFGDYETVGEAIVVANESDHVTTVWRARRSGATDLGEYVVKVYAPHRKAAPATQATANDALDRDRGLEFLEGIKQIKKAQAEGARCLAAVHAFGTSAEGVWYATDFFQRGSIATWISRRVNVDSAALRQIVACLVTGCLELKRSRGNSHGNLKTSNVFLVGTTRPLRKTPLVLADAHPAAPLKLASLEGEDRRSTDELLHQVMEVQDLRAIGEIILQLVEGRLVSSAYDYNYPVPRSAVWNLLGKDGERWRELCNQLLDPQLSLEEVSLETLAKKFSASGSGGKLLPIAAVFVVAGLAGAGVYGFKQWSERRNAAQFEQDMQAAKDLFDRTNLISAWDKIGNALNKRAGDSDALARKAEIEKRNDAEADHAVTAVRELFGRKRYQEALSRLDWASSNLRLSEALASSAKDLRSRIGIEKEYDAAMEVGQNNLADRNFSGAMEQANQALKKKPADPAATRLKELAQNGINNQTVAERLQNYKDALAAGQKAYAAQDYAAAFRQAEAALANQSGDAVATKLKADAQARMGEQAAQAERDQKYKTTMDAGQKAYESKDYAGTIRQADMALLNKTGDAAATKLKADAQARMGEVAAQAEQDQKYKTAMDAGQKAYESKDYAGTIRQADVALSNKAGDAAATKLKAEAQARQGEVAAQAERDKNYQVAITAGQKAYESKDYAGTIRQADVALSNKAGDAAATKLKTDAQARQGEVAAQAERDQKYSDALAAARKAYEGKDYAAVIKHADVALLNKAGDAVATKLKADAQARQDEAAAQVERDKKYQAAMTAGQKAYELKDYAGAIAQADVALLNKTGDAAATKLKTDAQTRQGEVAAQAERDKNYQVAITAGQKAYDSKDYTGAIAQADVALLNRAGDVAATKLKTDARARQDEVVAQMERDKKYQAAMTAGQKAFAVQDYAGAVNQAEVALLNRSGDADAMRLKEDAGRKVEEVRKRMQLADKNDTDLKVLLIQLGVKQPNWLTDKKLPLPPGTKPDESGRGNMLIELQNDYERRISDLTKLCTQAGLLAEPPGSDSRGNLLQKALKQVRNW